MNNDSSYGSCNTSSYQGKRTDLENDEMGNYYSKSDMEKVVMLWLKREPWGITAALLEDYTGCSREWARKTLNRMADEGKVKKIEYTNQCIVFRITEAEAEEEVAEVPPPGGTG